MISADWFSSPPVPKRVFPICHATSPRGDSSRTSRANYRNIDKCKTLREMDDSFRQISPPGKQRFTLKQRRRENIFPRTALPLQEGCLAYLSHSSNFTIVCVRVSVCVCTCRGTRKTREHSEDSWRTRRIGSRARACSCLFALKPVSPSLIARGPKTRRISLEFSGQKRI